MTSPESIRDLARPRLTAIGLELWDVEISRDVLRVLIDRPGGVDLETLTAASAVLSSLLEDHPQLAPDGSYQLEVSSPGVERSLRSPEQYRLYLGTLLTVKMLVSVMGSRRWRGRLVAAGDDSITIAPEDSPGEATVELRYDQIDRSRTVLEWGPSPKPGRSPGAPKKTSARARDRSSRGSGAAASNLKDSV